MQSWQKIQSELLFPIITPVIKTGYPAIFKNLKIAGKYIYSHQVTHHPIILTHAVTRRCNCTGDRMAELPAVPDTLCEGSPAISRELFPKSHLWLVRWQNNKKMCKSTVHTHEVPQFPGELLSLSPHLYFL